MVLSSNLLVSNQVLALGLLMKHTKNNNVLEETFQIELSILVFLVCLMVFKVNKSKEAITRQENPFQ